MMKNIPWWHPGEFVEAFMGSYSIFDLIFIQRPTNIKDMERLSTHTSARCLRIRVAAIQEAMTQFNNTAIIRWLCLWLDQHAPLMLALEKGTAGDDAADDYDLDPMEQQPLLPEFPEGCKQSLPMLWASRSSPSLKKWPLLKLLWKASPRKCHSKDVQSLVQQISGTSREMAKCIYAIYKSSLLGNYAHAKKRPPLPLRFSIYRKPLEDLNEDASSQHPFFLYSLKEFLISVVADDFGLRYELYRNPAWKDFEDRVIDCCDRMIRPYSCIAPVVSARLLLSQGKGATLPPSALSPQNKIVQALIRKSPKRLAAPGQSPKIRAVQYEEWVKAKGEGIDAVSLLLQKKVNLAPVPFHSWPLPKHTRDLQEAAVHPPAPRAAIYCCRECRSGLFVGHSVGGKKCEALGDVFTKKWHCAVCKHAPVLECISLIGQVVQCSTGCFTACTKCPFPSRFFESGLVCAACTKIARSQGDTSKFEGKHCWFDGCKKRCTASFEAVPFGGIEQGDQWETLWACPSHTFPDHLTQTPIPRENMKKTWWAWKRGAN